MKGCDMARREFCLSAAGATVAKLLVLPETASGISKVGRKLQIGLIGSYHFYGSIEDLYSWMDWRRANKQSDIIEIKCIYEPNQRLRNRIVHALHKFYGMNCKGYTSFQEMMRFEAGKLDAAFVFSQECRERYVSECLSRKIPCFFPPPLAITLEDGRDFTALIRKTGALLSCGILSKGWRKKMYGFCREKLCGENALLGACVSMKAETYIDTCKEMSQPLKVTSAPSFFTERPSASPSFPGEFWEMIGTRSLLTQCRNFLRIHPELPKSVTGFQGPFGKYISSADHAVFLYGGKGRTFFADLSLFNRFNAFHADTLSFRGDFGIVHLSSFCARSRIELEICSGICGANYQELWEKAKRRWYPAIRNPEGILGECVDTIGVNWKDERSYIWRFEDPDGNFNQKAFDEFEKKGEKFEGKRDLWKFPKEILNDDPKAGFENCELTDFLEMVRTGRTDLESVKEVYRAQVMVCGIAESVRTGKPFHFTPEMFEI